MFIDWIIRLTYALEGSIFIAGAGVQWLRDKIKLINNAYETEIIAKSTKSNKEVYVVPAFSGIGAPYWRPDARGLITGLTRDSDWKNFSKSNCWVSCLSKVMIYLIQWTKMV